MKQLIITTILVLLAWGLTAHPASTANLSYDAKTQLLTLSFDHQVKNPADHFISAVLIKVGGKTLVTQNINAQETAAGGSFVYKLIGIKTGTVIEAVTTCNKTGNKSAKLTVK